MFCSKCGKEINDEAVICIHCGCAIEGKNIANSKKTFTNTLLFCIFLGGFGAHRFYTGQIGSAIAQLLLSLSVFGFIVTIPWVIVDLILILTNNFKTSDGSALVK